MFQSVLTIGIILVAVAIVLSLVLLKATPKEKYTGYIPNMLLFAAGLILLLFATYGKVEIMGAGLGGWGIACLFAGAIGFIVTSIVDANANANVNA